MVSKDREEILRAALEDALEGLMDMLPYVPDYFVARHALNLYVIRARDALEATRDPA